MDLEIEPLEGPLGAIVRGWDPTQTLDVSTRQTILDSLHEHLVLVFRGQPVMTDGQIVGFAEQFGDLLKGSAFFESAREYPEILHVGNLVGEDGKPQGAGGTANILWHADYSFSKRVGSISFLNAVELPSNPPHTYFVDQYRPLDDLSSEIIEKIRPLRAFHSTAGYADRGGTVDAERAEADIERDRKRGIERPPVPEAIHPIIVRHPETGRELLYVGPGLTQEIVGLERSESDALMAKLCAHLDNTENVYAHEWEVGDMVVFDTLATLHKRDSWDPSERRHMRQLSTTCQID